MENTEKLIEFIKNSPDCFHAVYKTSQILEENGFCRLYESENQALKSGSRYYVTRNNSSIIAFKLPERGCDRFLICASHTDSPSFKLKPVFELDGTAGMRLSVEGCGGMIMSTWLDRPLSVSGRVITLNDGTLVSRLVNIDRDLAVIPSLAIHLCRDANKGYEFNIKRDMCPLTGGRSGDFMSLVSDAAGVRTEDIKGFELSLYNRSEGRIFGSENEYFCAPRIDDLQCVFSSLEGFLLSDASDAVQVFSAFDSEEVGSGTKQGALSTFLFDTLRRINDALGMSDSDYRAAIAKSIMLSCDNAHAVHPNHTDKSDETNRVFMNGGIVIKYNANQKYTTDAVSEAAVKYVCESAGVPYQLYTNRSDMPGGSTLGNLSSQQVPLCTADIGLAQLAMHSCMETAGARDTTYMIKAVKEFYGTDLKLQ